MTHACQLWVIYVMHLWPDALREGTWKSVIHRCISTMHLTTNHNLNQKFNMLISGVWQRHRVNHLPMIVALCTTKTTCRLYQAPPPRKQVHLTPQQSLRSRLTQTLGLYYALYASVMTTHNIMSANLPILWLVQSELCHQGQYHDYLSQQWHHSRPISRLPRSAVTSCRTSEANNIMTT